MKIICKMNTKIISICSKRWQLSDSGADLYSNHKKVDCPVLSPLGPHSDGSLIRGWSLCPETSGLQSCMEMTLNLVTRLVQERQCTKQAVSTISLKIFHYTCSAEQKVCSWHFVILQMMWRIWVGCYFTSTCELKTWKWMQWNALLIVRQRRLELLPVCLHMTICFWNGLRESFTARRPCRECTLQKIDFQKFCVENKSILWTVTTWTWWCCLYV